jgi:NADH-quinone oxidoreductase subunit N
MQLPAGFSHLFDHTGYLVPELVLLTGAVCILICGFFPRLSAWWLTTLAAAVLALAAVLLATVWPEEPQLFFFGMLRLDQLAAVMRLLLTGTALLVLFFPIQNGGRSAEYLFFVLTLVLGGNLLCMSADLLAVLLSLELISISSYALTGFSFSRAAAEGSWKYFLVGSVATAITIFGMSYVFGATGTTQFTSDRFLESALLQPSTLLAAGALLTLAGFLFKIGAAPFHWWAPDAYQSAPIAVAALLSTVPKVAGTCVLIRFTVALHTSGHDTVNWVYVLAIVALATLLTGTLGGLLQRDARRLMAYSSIAQSGFVLVGVACLTPSGVQTALFYLATLVVMNLLTFRSFQSMAHITGTWEISGWAGQGRQWTLLTLFLTGGLVALAGLPPTGGFMAKVFVFTALWSSYQTTSQPLLAILLTAGLAATVAGLFFYLKAPYYLVMKGGSPTENKNPTPGGTLFLWIMFVLTLLLFFQPGLLMGWLNRFTFVD